MAVLPCGPRPTKSGALTTGALAGGKVRKVELRKFGLELEWNNAYCKVKGRIEKYNQDALPKISARMGIDPIITKLLAFNCSMQSPYHAYISHIRSSISAFLKFRV